MGRALGPGDGQLQWCGGGASRTLPLPLPREAASLTARPRGTAKGAGAPAACHAALPGGRDRGLSGDGSGAPGAVLEPAMTMMAHLQGVIVAKTVERVVVDVQGVGYHVVVPLSTYYVLPELQERVTLLTTMYVRADTLRLYGFATPDEQDLFERLISVASVGPRLALNMLSSLSAADLRQAIVQADTRQLQAIPGVGRKTAERVVLELQDTMAGLDLTRAGPRQPVVTADEQVIRDVVSALLNFGYRHTEADKAVRAVRAHQEGSLTVEALLKAALQALVR